MIGSGGLGAAALAVLLAGCGGAEVLLGEDLYANWCDDVVGVGEPETVVEATWPITSGTIRLEQPLPGLACPSRASAELVGLVATRPDGSTVELGGREVGNDPWGCFAG